MTSIDEDLHNASNLRERKSDWLLLALMGFLASLFGLGVGGLWRCPMTYDEFTYYLPALRDFSSRLPDGLLNPLFPGPPTGLIVQLPVFLLFDGSIVALRAYSTLATAAMAVVLFFYLRRHGRTHREAVQLLVMSASMFVIYYGFIVKQHAFMLLFLVSALVIWERMVTARASFAMLAACSMLLTLAVTTNQLVAPVCAALAFESWRSRGESSSAWWWRAVAALAPTIVLAMFFLVWRGTIPPAYRSNPMIQSVKFGTLHPVQVLVAFLVLGLWLAPSFKLDRQSLVRSFVLSLPFVVTFYWWNGYRADVPFNDTIVGPISSALRFLASRSRLLSSIVAGLLCGIGAEFVFRVRNEGAGLLKFDVLVISYLGMMLVVPYLFEGYYFILLVAGWFALRSKMAAESSPITLAHQAIVVIMGVVYTVYKVAAGSSV